MSQSLISLVASVKALPPVNQRKVAALIGATVADAAAKPLHWIYNQDELDTILADSTPEFFPESKCPFYLTPAGARSTYNEICLATLEAMHRNNGIADVKTITDVYVENFGPGTSYEDAYKRRRQIYDADNRSQFKGPIPGPWLHGSLIKFLEKVKENADGTESFGDSSVDDNDGFCAALPFVVKYSDTEDMWERSLPVAKILCTNEQSLRFYQATAVMLQSFIRGEHENALEHAKQFADVDVLAHLNEVEESLDKPYITTVSRFGKACSLPGSFKGAYLTLLQTKTYVDAVRWNISAGGCNCSRGNIIGACYGAKYGIDAIPIEWMSKVLGIENILKAVIEVVEGKE